MAMSLSKLWKMVKDREAWHVVANGVTKSWTQLSNSTTPAKPKTMSCLYLTIPKALTQRHRLTKDAITAPPPAFALRSWSIAISLPLFSCKPFVLGDEQLVELLAGGDGVNKPRTWCNLRGPEESSVCGLCLWFMDPALKISEFLEPKFLPSKTWISRLWWWWWWFSCQVKSLRRLRSHGLCPARLLCP